MLINVSSIEVVTHLNAIAQKAYDEQEFLLLLGIYNTNGIEAVKKACDTSKFTRQEMLDFTGRNVLTINGWVQVLSCKPIANSQRFAATFSDNPDEVYILDSTGYNSDKRIYQITEKMPTFEPEPPKRKRGRPRKDKPIITPQQTERIKELEKTIKSDLMTEPDFPLPSKD